MRLKSQQFTPSRGRACARRLSGYFFTVLAALLITIGAPYADAQCKVVYTISPQNSSAFGAAVTIQNTGGTTLSNWSLTWTFSNGQTIASSWNGAVTQSGANVTVSQQAGQTWQNIPAGGSYSGFGFNGTWNGTTNAVPTNFALNGTACNSPLIATTTTLTSSSTSVATGASVTLTATVAPTAATGTVTFLDGTTSLGTGTLSAGKATLATSLSTAGTHSITAVYGGSATYAGSTSSSPIIITVTPTKTATTTALTVSPTSVATGATVTLTATVTPSTATGTVTFMDGTTSLGTGTLSAGKAALTTSFSTAGTHSITAVYGGSTTFTTSTSSAVIVTVTSTKTATTTALTGSPTSVATGISVTLTATVSPSTATGTLTFLDGTTTLGTGTLSAGKATLITSFSTAGTHLITASYGGSTTFATSISPTVSITVTSTKTVTTTALTVSNTTPTVGTSVTLTAAVSPSTATGTVTFMSGTTTLGTGTLSSGVAALTTSFATAGVDSLTAVYGGSTTFATSTSSAVSIAVIVNTTNAVVSLNPSNKGIAVSDTILGMNLASWYDISDSGNGPAVVSAFTSAGIKAVRWPGGSWSDIYHWSTNTNCFSSTDGAPQANDTFANFVNDIAIPGGLDVSLTADYGTNAACTGGGDPTEAAAWATKALSLSANVSHFTVGNEEYGSWEEDLHSAKNDATTYANAVATGYYPDIKAASPNVLVGVVVNPGNSPAWDPIVLAGAKYDFVEYHYYPEAPGAESDTTLVQQDAQNLTASINTIKSELAAAGHSGTPIFVGEIGGPYSNPGKQSWSITQGLYAGQVLGEMMNDGVTRLTWWIGFGNCNGQSGNDSSSLYGWQNFGAYNVFSDGPNDPTCPSGSTAPDWGAIGTMSPTARAFQLFSNVAVNGEFVLTPTVTGDTTDVVAYAATHSGGTALVLFNRNETTSQTVQIQLTGKTSSSLVTVETYNKALYDQTNATTPVWAAPTTTSLGSQSLPLTLTLTPWSMNVVIIN